MRRSFLGFLCSSLLLAGTFVTYASGQGDDYHGYGDQYGYGDGYGGDGYNVFRPAIGVGCFGEVFPVLRMQFIPGPTGYGYGGETGGSMPGDAPPGTMPPARNGKTIESDKGGKSIESQKGGKSIESPKGGKSIESPKDGKSIEKDDKPELELELPGFHQLMSRQQGQPDAARAARELTATRKMGRASKAIDLSGLTAKDAEPLFWKGYRLYWDRKPAEALPLFEAAAELSDQDARFWYFRALAESALGRATQSEASVRQAVDLHLRGLPGQDAIRQALERVQGDERMRFREALDARRAAR